MTLKNLPLPDPTRPMREKAIRKSVERAKALIESAVPLEMTPNTIAQQAKLRIERSKESRPE